MHFFRLALAFALPTLALASYNQTKADIDTISSLLDTLSSDAKNMKTGDAAVPLALQCSGQGKLGNNPMGNEDRPKLT